MLNIERIQYQVPAKYDIMNAQYNKNEDKESEKALCVAQIIGKSYNCDTYGHKSRDFTDRK